MEKAFNDNIQIILEIMNGKPDTSKGSYYNNPIHNTPLMSPQSLDTFKADFPAYAYDNIWPSEVPLLEHAFMSVCYQ